MRQNQFYNIQKEKYKKIFFQKVIHEVPKSFFRIPTISGLSLERRANKFFQKSMLYGSLYFKFYTDNNFGQSGPTYV